MVLQTLVMPKTAEPPAPPSPVVQQQPDQLVELKGVFGKAQLQCRHVQFHDNMVILVQRMGSNSYEPPPSDQPCLMTIGATVLQVYVSGVNFPLKPMGLYCQVFVRAKE